MAIERLSALDTTFLEVESPTAHMHVGWSALLDPGEGGRLPSVGEVRAHIANRLSRAPRYRQRLLRMPLGTGDPVWVDDEEFDIARHVFRARSPDFESVTDMVMSRPLRQDRPLWEVWVADSLADGRLGIVGKAHHCMVDGLAAVELAALLLDATPDVPAAEPDAWTPSPPGAVALAASAAHDRGVDALRLARASLRWASSPRVLAGAPRAGARSARALVHAVRPATPDPGLNRTISASRHVARVSRPLADLMQIKRRFGVTVNDVVLAASSGGLRHSRHARSGSARELKTMVPVSIRHGAPGESLGNHISFVFVDLPCHEPDPIRRLQAVSSSMAARKEGRVAEGAGAVVRALGLAPRVIRSRVSRLAASSRAFNLTVSNIPGPVEPLYLLGCELDEVYPVVPIADGHALSIGMTTIRNRAFFGIYADRAVRADADLVGEGIDRALDELLAIQPAPVPVSAG